MKKSTSAILVLLGLVLSSVWLHRSTAPDAADESHSSATVDSPAVALPDYSSLSSGTWQLLRTIPERRILAAIETHDPSKWSPLLAELKSPYIRRGKVLDFLTSLLKSPDLQVRLAVARLLFELGSNEGGPEMVALIRSPETVSDGNLDVFSIVSTLHQYRYPVDPDLVFDLYRRLGDTRLLLYAQLMGSSEAIDVTRERLLRNGAFQNSAMLAGMMGLADRDSLNVYTQLLESARPEDAAEGAWALFMATGEARHLDYLIGVIEEAIGLRPESGDHQRSMRASRKAMQALQQTVVPEATAALRRIERKARATKSFDIANASLLALFYLHRDYDYVDEVLVAEFQQAGHGGAASELLMQLAAARASEPITRLARNANPEAFERTFILSQGRPIEAWIFQYIHPYIPDRIRPPIGG